LENDFRPCFWRENRGVRWVQKSPLCFYQSYDLFDSYKASVHFCLQLRYALVSFRLFQQLVFCVDLIYDEAERYNVPRRG
jgi:hypothetical protein